jgi:dolichol kinase|tara:strand:- start:3465 stop:4052 length:588 start_codon:yes stop_codon:yes gene_type:complete
MLTKLEIKRQVFHIFFGIFLVLLLHFDFVDYLFLLIFFIIGLILSLSSKNIKIPLIHNFLKTFDREKDLETFPGKGAIFYVLGAFIVVLFFPKDIALASIMILALGDSISRLIGPYGYLQHPFHNKKFLEGAVAGIIAGFLGALFFVSWIPALIASTISMFLEGLDLRIKKFKIDDNLLIPVVAAAVMHSFSLLF